MLGITIVVVDRMYQLVVRIPEGPDNQVQGIVSCIGRKLTAARPTFVFFLGLFGPRYV